MVKRTTLLGMLLAAQVASAQPGGPTGGAQDAASWLAGEQAQVFRMRVAELALLYGSSSGIDPAGFRVKGTRQGEAVQDCAQVELVTYRRGAEQRREQVRACRHR